jgi:hypothetical protein
MDRDEMSNLYIGPSIDASYQISDQLALRFQRRRLKCEKLTDDERWMPSDGKSSQLKMAIPLNNRSKFSLISFTHKEVPSFMFINKFRQQMRNLLTGNT